MNCCFSRSMLYYSILQFSVTVICYSVFANCLPVSVQQVQPLYHDQEKLALLHFKQSFLITCLASHPDFANPKTESWWDSPSSNRTSYTSDCCLWDGVKCDKETGHVIGLDLSSSCLFGTFPHNSALFGLDHLQDLDLSDNHFNFSQIPPAIGHLSKLTKLNLSESSFMGQVPIEISKLSRLTILDISENYDLEFRYDMSFDKFVGNLTDITKLNLNGVDISSAVPAVLSNFTLLQSLQLVNCHIFGTFPSAVFQLPKLEVIGLSYNTNLRGHLPEFTTHSPLRTLAIVGTEFTGPIPSSLCNLTKLSFLKLWSKFSGELPLPITNLTQLTTLFIGDIPISSQSHMLSWLHKLTKLEKLGLRNMTLTGEIPHPLAKCTRLSWLNLSLNKLTGPLPLWLANITKLAFLDLSGNKLQGPIIPQWFSKLINLETLALSSDGSVGMFETLQKLPYLSSLDLSGVKLIFPPNVGVASTNSSFPKFGILALKSCNITEFPQFLCYQDELQLLDLSENNIMGTIPQCFVKTTMKSLLGLWLTHNHLTGFEQPQNFLPWYNLEVLDISDNRFQGRLPSPPNSLESYQASRNEFYGVIPDDICKANSMTFLDLSMNNFIGRIPVCITNYLSASLVVLNMRGNHFEGPMPQNFTRTCKLKMINLSDNQLNGHLPKSLTNCGSLQVLDVGRNQLNDTFPSWLGSLPDLQVLVLRHNMFNGRITALESGHEFSCLRVIDLSNNFHVGNLPSTYLQNWLAMKVSDEAYLEYSSSSDISISASDSGVTLNEKITYTYVMTITNKGSEQFYSAILTVFRAIDLSSNNFTGEIPDIIGNLTGLQALNLSNNHLTGGIPSSLANVIDLEALDLSQNMLSGEIPQKFSKLTSFEVFNVSHNRLVGPIPQGEQFNTFDNSSFIGNLALCGAPLSNLCRYMDSPPTANEHETEEHSGFIDWIIRSSGCVGGCIVGFIIGKIFITDPYHDWFTETFGRGRQ